jgi:hypothetical protein
MKEVTLTMRVLVPDSVEAANVAQQIGDTIDPDGWNWDVSFPWVEDENTVPDDSNTMVIKGQEGDPAVFKITSPFISAGSTMTATTERDGVPFLLTITRAG